MTKVLQISTIFIISTLLLITNAAPQSKDLNEEHKSDLNDNKTIRIIFEDHRYESSEEHSVEYNDHHHHSDKNHKSCEDSHEDSNSSSLERTIDNLNKTIKSLNSTKGPGAESNDNKNSGSHIDSKQEEAPSEVTEINTENPQYIENTQNPPQESATEDIFNLLDQTTPRQEPLDPRATKQLNPPLSRVSPVRKRRHAYGSGFSYGYSIQHYIDPHYYVHKPQYLVPLQPAYSYVSFVQSPYPGVATPHPPIYHGNSGESGENHGHNGSSEESEESTDFPRETSSTKPDENAVIPLATTQRPIEVKPTENSNNIPSFFEETDNTEYPQEVVKGTETPNQGTEIPDTTDNVFINLFGTE